MKAQSKSPLVSLERIAHAQGHGIFLVGAILLALWLGGHTALYQAYRSADPARAAEVQPAWAHRG